MKTLFRKFKMWIKLWYLAYLSRTTKPLILDDFGISAADVQERIDELKRRDPWERLGVAINGLNASILECFEPIADRLLGWLTKK